ncbi:hypothetical protein CK203_112175 [Vitis vinifera]|uniref:Uncharacterized protein n=1 Tax=Vitis vinifera TaxID=29760 RepID=A0A438D368_VITVI|nr:hypothetical protein CK203_112175 [Vitis vinifera]
MESGLLTPLAPKPVPPRFRLDLHCSYHQGPGHDTDHYNALRHAIQDLIDQVPPSSGDIHHIDLIEDDSIHMLSWDDRLPDPIVLHDNYEIDGVSLEDDDSEGREIQIVTRSGRIAQPPPPAVRPFEGATSYEEIRVETTTTPERLIHMMTADRATCIVFSDDDLPPEDSDHVRPLYITVGCSGRRVPSILLDNGSALNICPLATAIALGFAPSDFGPSTQTIRAYDSFEIPTSFNLSLGRPWIHRAGDIPSFLHQKVKSIHDGQVITVQSTRDMLASSEPILQISHSEMTYF